MQKNDTTIDDVRLNGNTIIFLGKIARSDEGQYPGFKTVATAPLLEKNMFVRPAKMAIKPEIKPTIKFANAATENPAPSKGKTISPVVATALHIRRQFLETRVMTEDNPCHLADAVLQNMRAYLDTHAQRKGIADAAIPDLLPSQEIAAIPVIAVTSLVARKKQEWLAKKTASTGAVVTRMKQEPFGGDATIVVKRIPELARQAKAPADHAIDHVAIDPQANTMRFYQKLHSDSDLFYQRGQWDLFGDHSFDDITEEDRDFWQPFKQIPTIITYVNYKFLTTHIKPDNTGPQRRLENILDEQMRRGAGIGIDLRQSIDDQIAAIAPDDVMTLLVEQLAGVEFKSPRELRADNAGPNRQGPVL